MITFPIKLRAVLLLFLSIFMLHSTFSIALSASAPTPKTGQTTSYAANDDGALQPGVAWPSPRFTDNANGSVTDNLTGLIWLKSADCFSAQSWDNALIKANTLASGACGLTDGSNAGDWHLPSKNELWSLVDYGHSNPALPAGHPFTFVQPGPYLTGTTCANYASYAWTVSMSYGYVIGSDKILGNVWPVRSGQSGNTSKSGDCNNDGTVTISEVQSAINMFLGMNTLQSCVNTDGDNNVSIAEVQKVINGFLGL